MWHLGASKSTVSNWILEATRQALGALVSRPLDGLRLVSLFIDGTVVAEHMVIAAMGLDEGGQKHVLGLWEGTTNNAVVCKALVSDLVGRGLRANVPLLVVIDGSKALQAAVRNVLGECAVVQRCQVHKVRTVLDHLPEDARGWAKRKLDRGYNEREYERALGSLKALAYALEKEYPGAGASLHEGLEETLTVLRLGLPELLRRSLRSTNVIESAIDGARKAIRNVQRWQTGEELLRWTAVNLLEAASRFQRIAGYRDLPVLVEALQKAMLQDESGNVTSREPTICHDHPRYSGSAWWGSCAPHVPRNDCRHHGQDARPVVAAPEDASP